MTLPQHTFTPPWLAEARTRWAPRTTEPVRIRAWLRQPVACDFRDGLRLDGALSWLVVTLTTGEPPREGFHGAKREDWTDIPLPFARVTVGGWELFAVSDAQWPEGAQEGVRSRRRKPHPEALGLNKVQTNGGPWKALDIITPTITTPIVEWYALADVERLTELLAETHCLGRGRAGGLGWVLGWEVSRVDGDRSVEWDGRLMRAVPVASREDAARRFPGADVRVQAVRPPFWHRAVKTLCAVPPPPAPAVLTGGV